MQNVMADSAVFAFLDGFSTLTVGIMFAILATNWLKIDGLTAGVLIAFVQYLDQIYDPIKQLGNKMATLQGVFAAIDRIFLIIDRDDVIRGTQDFTAQSMAIQFNNVSFSYFPTQEKNNEKLVLKNINFSMPEGQSLALVGPTGSGKSSVIKLLTKLYDGYAGHIFIGDQDLKDISPQSWVKNFAYVPQDPAIFNASIEYNIALGRPGITTQDIYESLKVVGLFDFVQSLPEGIGFILNEGGHNLSQGQRQLIAFARAIVTHPKLIILDEATASVDQESEKLIENATNEIFKGRSVVVIAHRLATIERADQIIVIKNGEIIQNKEEYYSGFSKEKSS